MTLFWNIVRSLRPIQWLKNVGLFAPLIFSGLLFYQPQNSLSYFTIVTYAAFLFCLLSSSIYLVNDIVDRPRDRRHPLKKNRPIAAGKVPLWLAWALAGILFAAAILLSLPLPIFFTVLILLYAALQVMYSLWLKEMPIFDVLSIALGFLIRVYAGAAVVNLHMNVWFLLTVISASLFLAVGKRQSELTILGGENSGATRKTLQHYPQALLDQYIGMFASATWLTYALFTFQYQFIREISNTALSEFFDSLPQLLQPEKVLMLTIPIVIFGVMRYLQIIYEKRDGESPALVLLKDKLLLGTVLLFGISVIVIVYAGEVFSWF